MKREQGKIILKIGIMALFILPWVLDLLLDFFPQKEWRTPITGREQWYTYWEWTIAFCLFLLAALYPIIRSNHFSRIRSVLVLVGWFSICTSTYFVYFFPLDIYRIPERFGSEISFPASVVLLILYLLATIKIFRKKNRATRIHFIALSAICLHLVLLSGLAFIEGHISTAWASRLLNVDLLMEIHLHPTSILGTLIIASCLAYCHKQLKTINEVPFQEENELINTIGKGVSEKENLEP